MDSRPGRQILLLGPVAVVENGSELDLGGRAQRTLLAALALHAGRPVSVDRLLAALWPAGPPPQAAKTLQVYVSRLRGRLGAEAILHRAGGYTLTAAAGTVDAFEFEHHYASAHDRSEAGNVAGGAAELRAALALWRGRALEAITDGALAADRERLESLRWTALEARISADLHLGQHQLLVPELEQLVREQPYRETLRMQLMLALYRCGRQAEALAVHRHGRALLRNELGIEPRPELGQLEQAILNHAPELRAVASDRPSATGARRARSARVVVATGLVLATAFAGLALVVRSTGTNPRLRAVPDSLDRIDPATNALAVGLPIGSAPVAVTTGGGSVWVANAGDQTLTRIDPTDHQILWRAGLGRIPSQLAYAAGSVWVASAIGTNGVVQRVDPSTGTVVSSTVVRVRAGYGDNVFAPPTPSALATGAGRVWTNSLVSGVAHFASSGTTVTTDSVPAGGSVDGIAVGGGSVWVTSGAGDEVVRLDARSGEVTAEIPLTGAHSERVASPYGIAVGFGAVWVTDAFSGTVSVIDPRIDAVAATIRVGTHPTRLAIGEGAVWVVNAGSRSVSRIDPQRLSVVATVPVGGQITGIAAGLHGVWLTVAGGVPDEPGTRPPATLRPVPGCSPVAGSADRPSLLIASELPTYRGESTPDPLIAQMRAAIVRVLKAHRFRAGPYRIGYQACDDSARGEGTSPNRCAANARAYALDPSVVGIIGPFDSGCAEIGLPVLNAAPGGPVPVVSPSNTYVGLTHAGPATAADEPARYRPTGARNYVRLLGSDDVQGAAIAMYLHHDGRHRVYLLDDGDGTGIAGADYVAHAAAPLGVAVAGRRTWDAAAPGYVALAARIKATGADAVVLSGCVCANGLELVRDLRAVLGRSVSLVGTDNFTDTDAEYGAEFGPLGLHIAVAGVAGRRTDALVRYAATAVDVLLDAVGRSDGTRVSVDRALFTTQLDNPPVGPISFAPSGDPISPPVTIYRVDPSASARDGWSDQGLVGEQTYRPRRDLVR